MFLSGNLTYGVQRNGSSKTSCWISSAPPLTAPVREGERKKEGRKEGSKKKKEREREAGEGGQDRGAGTGVNLDG